VTRSGALPGLLVAFLVAGGLAGGAGGTPAPYRVGAVFPLHGPLAASAHEEYLGVDIARELVNQDGGVAARPIALDVQELDTQEQAAPAVQRLRADGVDVVIGGYSSELSIPASADASADGLVYWEAGAVADRITQRDLPLVFRVGATGANLGSNSGRFAVDQLAPRLHRAPSALRASLVVADDAYAHSVADAAGATVMAAGMPVVSSSVYDPLHPDFAPVLATLRAAHPDILILASHIPDGIAFRRAILASGLHVGAFIGSTMAQCMDDFGEALGPDAVGVFASDRPGAGFDPATLRPEGRALYERFAARWRARTGETPGEEGLSGFSAAWTLFHDILPRASAAGRLDPQGIAAAAQSVDLPEGSLPNAAGVRFATTPDRLGQNLRAAAVIWQWQSVRHSVVVWPSEYATGVPRFVPLPR